MAKYKVVMVRHGDSEWNKHNRFCGWYDALLSDIGVGEAARCGEALKNAGFQFDLAFTSFLTRPQQTLEKVPFKCREAVGLGWGAQLVVVEETKLVTFGHPP